MECIFTVQCPRFLGIVLSDLVLSNTEIFLKKETLVNLVSAPGTESNGSGKLAWLD